MYTMTTVICNPEGLHARPAALFVSAAGAYKDTKITIGHSGQNDAVNAKSIVMLLSLAAMAGDAVEISANGPQEEEAVQRLITLIDSGFHP